MKNLISTTISFLIFVLNNVSFSQFTPNYSENYFVQKNRWNHYFDSLTVARLERGLNHMKGTAYSDFGRWQQYWDLYMPISGSFQDALQVLEADRIQSQKEQFIASASVNEPPTRLNVTPQDWDEIGPKSLEAIKGNYSNNWINPHINNNGLTGGFSGHVGKVGLLYQHPINDNIVFAITGDANNNGGGLFKSEDGGHNWFLLGTDKIPSPDIVAFNVKPLGQEPYSNKELLFIGLSNGAVYRSDNDGLSWMEAGYSGTSSYPIVFDQTNRPLSLPATAYFRNGSQSPELIGDLEFAQKYYSEINDFQSILIVPMLNEIYFSNSFGAQITTDLSNFTLNNLIEWQKFDLESIKQQIISYQNGSNHNQFQFTDFEVAQRGNAYYYIAQVLYSELDGDNKPTGFVRQYLIYSTDYGVTWGFLGGLGSPNTPQGIAIGFKVFTHGNIELKENGPNILYLANNVNINPSNGTVIGTNTSYGLHKFDFNQNEWTDLSEYSDFSSVINTQPNGFAFNSSDLEQNDETEWWFYTNEFRVFKDNILYSETPNYSGKYHADVRDLLVLRNGELLIGTDGGVYRSSALDGGHNFTTSSEGINAAQSRNMAVAQKPPFYVASGFWHGGLNIYNPETGEWHWRETGDGQAGEIFFQDNEVFTVATAIGVNRVYKNYNELNTEDVLLNYNSYIPKVDLSNDNYVLSGATKSSENKEGRAYGVKRIKNNIDLPYRDEIVYTNENFNTFGLPLPLSFDYPFPLNSIKPLVIPNEPDKLVLYELSDNGNFLHVFTGMNQDVPVPDHHVSWNLDQIYDPSGVYKAGNVPVTFDCRKSGKFWVVLAGYPPWGQSGLRRIMEFDPTINGFVDLTFKTDDFINSTTPNQQFPIWYDITSIEQDRQTGILYIGTTRGVYYLDRENQIWRKYSKNLPMFGPKIAITHCTGEINVSTQGRGIWKTNLIRTEEIPTLEWKISTRQTWSDRTNLFCTLIVEPNVTLTLSGKIVVYGNQKIIVKPRGKLIIDGGTITTECGDFWQGIEVWGNSALAQKQTIQGTLILKNGATIENAKEAIGVWKADDWNSGGGIIDASNSFFKNNWRSVGYMPYHSYNNTGAEIKNKGKFINCEFTWDDNFYNDKAEAGITMFHVNGVIINGCDFIDNRLSSTLLGNRAYGIYTIDAGYKVLGKYLRDYISEDQDEYYSEVNYDVCHFKNLQNGVYAMNSNSQSSITVDHCKFEDMVNGVVVRAMDNAVITRNKFDFTNNHSALLSAMVGVGLVSSTGFMVEGNRFLNQVTTTGTAGCLVYDAGVSQNQVYKNIYSNLYSGNYAYGQNSNDLGSFTQTSGLQFLCNNYSNAKQYDLHVYALPNASFGDGQGIRLRQGMYDEPAGNVFSSFSQNQSDKFHILSTDNNNLRYYYTDLPNQNPIFNNGLITTILSQDSNACLTHFSGLIVGIPPMLTPEKKQELLVSLANMNNTYEIKKHDLEQKMLIHDGAVVHDLVLNLTNANKTAVKNELLAHSPYLSEALLIELGEKTPSIFPNAWFKELISANIEIMQSKSFTTYLETKTNPLPSGLKALLEQEKNSISSERGVKLDELANLSTKKTQLLNLLIQNELSDSSIINWDEVDNFINQRNDVIKLSQKADLHLGKSELAPCNARLDEIDAQLNEFSMPDIQQEMADFSTFKHYVLSFANQQGVVERIDDTQKQQLVFMADNFKGKAAVQARNLLCFHLGLCEEITPIYAPLRRSRENTTYTSITSSESLNEYVKIVPNPSNGVFALEVAETCEISQINITDIEGRIVTYQVLEETNVSKSIKLENCLTGLYFVKVSCVDGSSFVSRVLIQ